MKRTFNEIYTILNDKSYFSKKILSRLYLYKFIIRSFKKEFVLIENQTAITKISRRSIPKAYVNLIKKRNLLSYSVIAQNYIFKHKYNKLFSFELPFVNNVINKKNTFNSICYKLLTITNKNNKHFMLFIRVVKGGYLAYSNGLFGFLPRSQSIKLHKFENKQFNLKKNKKFKFKKIKKILKKKINLSHKRYIINWYKIKMKLYQIKNKLKVKNFKRKRKLKRSRLFLQKVRVLFLYDSKKNFRRTRTLLYTENFRYKLKKALKFKKKIWPRAKLCDIKNLIMNNKVFKQKKKAIKLLRLYYYGKGIKEKTKTIKFKKVRGKISKKQLLRFLL